MNVYRSKKSGQVIRNTYDRLLTQWGCEISERDIPGSYGTTHVIECGRREAPPCILFHGVGDDSALMWIYNAEYLSRSFHLYAVDTLGGPGKSEPDARYNHAADPGVPCGNRHLAGGFSQNAIRRRFRMPKRRKQPVFLRTRVV